jgi:S-adenosylmethionine hydrolase
MGLMHNTPVIAIISDFGLNDPFVGIMKGVIAQIAPQCKVIDISHEILQGDIQQAAVQLWMSHSYFPAGTIFLVIVDPGVGTQRDALLIEAGDYKYIGPNNGLFSYAVGDDFSAWRLTDPTYQLENSSATFHGRDIFAPAAAYTANGIPGEKFGSPIQDLQHLPLPRLHVEPGCIGGEVIYIDQFGNLLTSLGKFMRSDARRYQFDPWLPDLGDLVWKDPLNIDQVNAQLPNGEQISWVQTFADIPPGECSVLVGSTGLIEIAANNDSAQALTGLARGAPINLLV